MTYIEPDSPGGQPEIMPPDTPGPDIDPGSLPDEDPGSIPAEVPQPEPGGGEPGDSRPYG
jgi:hypothetical protein